MIKKVYQMNTTSKIDFIENWYAEPFTKRTSCEIPGQCGGQCDCGCPYNTMTELDRLPLIEEIAAMFPNEWLAFIISAEEDDDLVPTHGKLVAHSPDPDEIFNATNAVLWNQCVYTFFNGDFEAMEASYGDQLEADAVTIQEVAMPKEDYRVPPKTEPVPENLLDLIYSAVDRLYEPSSNLGEVIRRLRIAKTRLSFNPDSPLLSILDQALDKLEVGPPAITEAIWDLEEALAELEAVRA